MIKINNNEELPKQKSKPSRSAMTADKKREVEDALQKVYIALDLKRQVVGVRFLYIRKKSMNFQWEKLFAKR